MPRRLLALAAVLAVAACSGDDGSHPPPGTDGDRADVAEDRPYAVRRVTRTFVDSTRPTTDPVGPLDSPSRTLVTDLYVPGGGEPVPMIVLAHGLSGGRTKFTELAGRWAEAGYLVVVPDFPLTSAGVPDGPRLADVANQPGDLSFLITSVVALSGTPDSPVEDRVDADEIGVAGFSLGAVTVYGLAFNSCCRDDRVEAAVVMSGLLLPFDGEYDLSGLPLLVLHGDADTNIPFGRGHDAYEEADPPKFFVTLRGAAHSPPYEDAPSPHDDAVRDLTIDFWDAYLLDDPEAAAHLAAHDPGGEALVSVEAEA